MDAHVSRAFLSQGNSRAGSRTLLPSATHDSLEEASGIREAGPVRDCVTRRLDSSNELSSTGVERNWNNVPGLEPG